MTRSLPILLCLLTSCSLPVKQPAPAKASPRTSADVQKPSLALPTMAPAGPRHTNSVQITNILISWNLITNWLGNDPALTLGTGTNRATLDLSVLLTNLITGIQGTTTKAIAAPTMAYAASNGVVVNILGTAGGQFRAFYGPRSK